MALTKIPSELSSTTGIVDNSTATAITIDSNENVGIGTSSPISKMQVSGANNGDVFYLTSSDVEDDRGLIFSNSSNGIVWDLDAKGASSSFGQMTFSTNGTERMRIDSSGRVTMPYQPAFDARSNSTVMKVTLGVVPYSVATVNIGSGYSTSTYRFTAPVAGQYLISWFGLLGDQNTNGTVSMSQLFLRKNGSQIVNCHSNNNDYWEQASCTTVVSLAVNDYVDVYLNSGGIYYGDSTNHYSKFCGYLIG